MMQANSDALSYSQGAARCCHLNMTSFKRSNIGQWPESSTAFYYVLVNGGGCRTEYIVLVGGVDVNMFNGSQCAGDKLST